MTTGAPETRPYPVETASTIPANLYISPDVLDAEMDAVFHRTWQLVGHTRLLPEPGSYFTTTVGLEPVLVARGRDDEIRALSNVCRHRAGPVRRGAGSARSFQCRYHGWMYGLDGRLLATPEMDGACELDKEKLTLPRFDLALWNELVFVRIARSGPLIDELLSGLDEILAPFHLSDYRWSVRKDWTIACNWKVYVDNYLEGYHIPIVHPALNEELDYDRYEVETRKWFSIQHAPIRMAKNIRTAEGSSEARYLWVYPNLMLNVYPDNFSTNLIVPTGPETTTTIFEWYFRDAEAAERLAGRTVEFSDEIQLEDIEICEDVQRGLHSRTYERGRYSPRRENGVHHFHTLYRRAMAIETDPETTPSD